MVGVIRLLFLHTRTERNSNQEILPSSITKFSSRRCRAVKIISKFSKNIYSSHTWWAKRMSACKFTIHSLLSNHLMLWKWNKYNTSDTSRARRIHIYNRHCCSTILIRLCTWNKYSVRTGIKCMHAKTFFEAKKLLDSNHIR